MSNKNLNIIELILQALAMLLLFLPGMYSWQHWEEEAFGMYVRTFNMDVSFFHAAGNISALFSFLVSGLMLANIVMILISIFKFSKRNKVHIIIPILTIIVLVSFSIIANNRNEFGYCAPINWLFYFEIFLLLFVVLLAFMKNSKKLEKQPKTAINNADELRKFKELLDSGIISQEEFEAKKKQLLGL